MKFAVDAHLPPGLCTVLQAAGHDALHTRQLTAQNRTTDEVLNALSLKEQRVIVTKDTDFYRSSPRSNKTRSSNWTGKRCGSSCDAVGSAGITARLCSFCWLGFI